MPIKKLTKATSIRPYFLQRNIISLGLIGQLSRQTNQRKGRLAGPIGAKTLSCWCHQRLIQLPITDLQLVAGEQTVVTMAPQPLDQGLHLREITTFHHVKTHR